MSQPADLSHPLDDDELDRLERILLDRVDEDAVTDDADEGVLTVSELDGLLTALVSGPVTIVPSRWLPAVWGQGYLRGVELAADERFAAPPEVAELLVPVGAFTDTTD